MVAEYYNQNGGGFISRTLKKAAIGLETVAVTGIYLGAGAVLFPWSIVKIGAFDN